MQPNSVICLQGMLRRRTAVLPGARCITLVRPSSYLQRNKKEDKRDQPSHIVLALPVRYPSEPKVMLPKHFYNYPLCTLHNHMLLLVP